MTHKTKPPRTVVETVGGKTAVPGWCGRVEMKEEIGGVSAYLRLNLMAFDRIVNYFRL
ncbi:MAG: hypothetical protein HQK58_11315 [Deltaproteobacteria bacterium]|nr:hypothetical protein [Deltaproteobacteria bacterium]